MKRSHLMVRSVMLRNIEAVAKLLPSGQQGVVGKVHLRRGRKQGHGGAIIQFYRTPYRSSVRRTFLPFLSFIKASQPSCMRLLRPCSKCSLHS